MRMHVLIISAVSVVSIAAISRQSVGQGVVQHVHDELSYFQPDTNSPFHNDLVLTSHLNDEYQAEVLRRDFGLGKGNGIQRIREPLWSVYAGAIFLHRDNPKVAAPLGFDALGFDVGTRSGVDIDIRRRLGERHELQVRYFGIDGWSEQLADTGTIGLTDWATLGDYATGLHSTEINLRSRWNDFVTVLGGFRWVELNEQVNYQLNTVTNIPGFPPFFPPTSIPADFAQRSGTRNHLYGAQIGMDVLLWDRGGPLTVNTELKAGVYSNLAKNSGSLESPIGDIVGDGRTYHTAFLGELGINARYQLTRSWALRAGYQLLWLEGVAVVNENQVDALLAGEVNTGGSPFYHGAMVGTELRW